MKDSTDLGSLSRFAGLKFSEIKNCEIHDVDGVKIGRLIDAIFKTTKDGLHLSKFLVGGSRFEELAETLRLRPDVDPVFPVDLIQSIAGKRIKLKVKKDELKSTSIDADAISDDEIKLSWLSKMKLIDSKEAHIGNIIDIVFEKNNFKFIVGDGFFREFMEDLGLVADIDFLLEPSYVQEVDKRRIKLNHSRAELRDIFDRHLPAFKDQASKIKIDRDKETPTYKFP